MKFRSKLVWCVRSPIAASPKENKDRKWISGKDSAAAEHQSSIIGQMKTEQPNKRQTNKQLVRINREKKTLFVHQDILLVYLLQVTAERKFLIILSF